MSDLPFDLVWKEAPPSKHESGCVTINVFCKEKKEKDGGSYRKYPEEGVYRVDEKNNFEKCEEKKEEKCKKGCATINIFCENEQKKY